MARRPSYVSVPGSDRLRTQRRGASAAAAVEQAPTASLRRVEVEAPGGRVVVGPVLLQGAQVPLLLEVTDRLGPLLSPEAFVVYLHLYRLAVASGKNACRVSLGELARRCGLQGRRLNKAIADAVAAGAVVLIDRTRDGTLYRVRLPGEVLDEVPTLLPTPATTTIPSPAPPTTTPTSASTAKATAKAARPRRSRPAPTAATTAPAASTTTATTTASTSAATTAPRSVGDVCRWYEATWGGGPGRRGADVAAAVMALLEDGETFQTIPGILTRFATTAPQTTPLRDLERWR
jgi:hypothetical protein